MMNPEYPLAENVPAWVIASWPRVVLEASRTPELTLHHLGTRIMNPGDTENPLIGQTIWGGPLGDGPAGVAWDWVQMQEGVVALADPFGLVSNLRLVGDKGRALSNSETVMQLNSLVHALPWQSEVQRALACVTH